ncbi:hypothetical protein RCL1_002188 [Eukaryota sp. TZLM3-RCL]
MLDSPDSIQTQLHMGEGKTSVIVPLIIVGNLLKKLTPRSELNQISYANLVSNSNVLICSPEDRQSFFLKSKSENLESDGFNNIVEILDESDDILDPKNQLIFSYGHSQSVDGGSLRWIAAETVLQGLTYILGGITGFITVSDQLESQLLDYVLGPSSYLCQSQGYDFTTSDRDNIQLFAKGKDPWKHVLVPPSKRIN